MSYKTTKAEFDYFKKCACNLIARLGLLDWEWIFIHDDSADLNYRAANMLNLDAKLAEVFFPTEWNYKPSKKNIRDSAYHEVLEALLFKLRCYSLDHFAHSDSEVDEAIHSVIQRIQNVFLQ